LHEDEKRQIFIEMSWRVDHFVCNASYIDLLSNSKHRVAVCGDRNGRLHVTTAKLSAVAKNMARSTSHKGTPPVWPPSQLLLVLAETDIS